MPPPPSLQEAVEARLPRYLAELETLAITLVLRGWRHDVPSVWNARRVRT